ncbi:MAG: hypothetical protein MJD61_01480 [Proteobacteria bacterium]|nr:hypothetical protein [Pseudomonadota bacterium]
MRLTLGVAATATLVLCSVPLFGVHGAAAALVLGVLLPPWVAATGACLAQAPNRPPSCARLFGAGLMVGALVCAVPLLMLGLNALRVRNCAPYEGLLFMFLGPYLSCALAAEGGILAAETVPHARLARVLAAALPLAELGLALWRLYTTPAVFAYGHFFGYFPGPLYDADVRLPATYLVFRLGSLLLLAGIWIALNAARLPRRHPGRRAWLVAGAITACALALFDWLGPELGHRTTSAWIAERLGAERQGEHCTVVVPRELDRQQTRRLLQDCDFRVRQLQALLGVRQRRPVRVFFFRNPAEKRLLMGAGRTYVAKPWRSEAYLQLGGWPHPVLAHELAHVVSASMATGPFKVSGKLGGLWPSPALIEGLAVAASWPNADGLTPHQWARAMMEAQLAPPLNRIVGTSFLGQPAARAYTLAGSLLRFVLDQHGAAAVRRIYESGSVEGVLGMSIDELERRWKAHIAEVALPETARSRARARFASGSILASVCPHQVARLKLQLAGDLSAHDDARSAATCREILRIDPADDSTRAALVGVLARAGKLEPAHQQLNRLRSPGQARRPAPAPTRAFARRALADAMWQHGDHEQALREYQALLELPQSDAARRLLQVKTIALRSDPREQRLWFDLLVGGGRQAVDGALAVHLARELHGLRSDGLAAYLEGRQLVAHGRYKRAAAVLVRALDATLPTTEIELEARRLLGTASYAAGDLALAERSWRALAVLALPGGGLHAEAQDWLERIADGQ